MMEPQRDPRRRQEGAVDWEKTTWQGSRRSQLEHWARLSLDEIFAAQEEMAALARELAGDGARETRDGGPA